MAGTGTAHLRPVDEVLLQAQHLVVDFPAAGGKKVSAVADVSFDVAEGETLGVVGESGCGKSTSARALVQLPFSTVTTAATPTTAYREAGCACFRYAAPVPAPVAGTCTDVTSSPGSSAVANMPRKKSSAAISRSPLLPVAVIVAPSALSTVG